MITKEDQLVEEEKSGEEIQVDSPEVFKVEVYNTVNGVEGLIFGRECIFEKKYNLMKSVRQSIRDLGASITKASRTEASEDGSFLRIDFTDLVPVAKKTTGKKSPTSNVRKNASDHIANEIDIEILGIAHGNGDSEAKEEALANYDRHKLIHAFNTNLGDDEDGKKLSHYTTKKSAIESLLTS